MLLASLAAGCTGNTRQTQVSTQSPADSLVFPALMKDAENILRFDRTMHHLDTLTEDDAPVVRRFECTNVSKSPIVITRATSTCGCVTVNAKGEKLMPGETHIITVAFHPENHPGTIDTDMFVYLSSSEKKPVARLKLTGHVLPGKDAWGRFPHSMGQLRLKQDKIVFGEVEDGQRYVERILCGNSGTKPLRLKSLVLPPYATFHTEPEVIEAGEEADIVVTLDASRLPKGWKDGKTFPIIIEGPDARPSDRTLNIKVKRIKQQ